MILRRKREKKKTHIQRQCPRAVDILVAIHAHQALAVLEEPRLETDDDKLGVLGAFLDVPGYDRDLYQVNEVLAHDQTDKICIRTPYRWVTKENQKQSKVVNSHFGNLEPHRSRP